MSTTNYNCDQCGKPCAAKTVIYNRYKTHFCGKECKADHQRGAKDRAKDERIRELEAMLDEMAANSKRVTDRLTMDLNSVERDRAKLHQERNRWKGLAEAASVNVAGWADMTNAAEHENKALEQRNRKILALAWVGWASCLLCLLWALWGHFGRHLPTTKPDAGELVVGMQGESRTPHIAYVDSLGEWRDADNGERLEVTKWSRP